MIVLILLFTLCDWVNIQLHLPAMGPPKKPRPQIMAKSLCGIRLTFACAKEERPTWVGGFLVILLDKRGVVP